MTDLKDVEDCAASSSTFSSNSQTTCHFCGYESGRISNLKRHIKTMHEGPILKNLNCCNISFGDKAEYRVHCRKFHLNGHECQVCSKKFSRRALLRRHQSVHTGFKEFHCSQCPYSSSHKSNLERHHKTHLKKCRADSTTTSSSILRNRLKNYSNLKIRPFLSSSERRDKNRKNKVLEKNVAATSTERQCLETCSNNFKYGENSAQDDENSVINADETLNIFCGQNHSKNISYGQNNFINTNDGQNMTLNNYCDQRSQTHTKNISAGEKVHENITYEENIAKNFDDSCCDQNYAKNMSYRQNIPTNMLIEEKTDSKNSLKKYTGKDERSKKIGKNLSHSIESILSRKDPPKRIFGVENCVEIYNQFQDPRNLFLQSQFFINNFSLPPNYAPHPFSPCSPNYPSYHYQQFKF